MAAWANKVMAIPVDADSRIREAFVTTVEGDVIIDLVFVIFRVLLGAGHAGFFVGGEDKDKIALRLDLGGVKRANGGEQRFDISCVIADAGCVNTAVANGGFDFESRLEDRVHVCVENCDRFFGDTFARRDQVTGGVVTDFELVFA